jgi:hypothetical protein
MSYSDFDADSWSIEVVLMDHMIGGYEAIHGQEAERRAASYEKRAPVCPPHTRIRCVPGFG